MSPEQFAALERGDIVRNSRQARSWLVAANNGDHVALVDYRHASNPDEWELVLKAGHVDPGRCPEAIIAPELDAPVQCELLGGHHGLHRHGLTKWPTPGGGR